MANGINHGDVLVLRYEGARKAAPACAMLAPTSAIIGKGMGETVAPDHRRPLLGWHLGHGGWPHRTGKHKVGGLLALVEEGDSITVDAHQLLIQLNVDEATSRRAPRQVDAAATTLHQGVCSKGSRCWRAECQQRRSNRSVTTGSGLPGPPTTDGRRQSFGSPSVNNPPTTALLLTMYRSLLSSLVLPMCGPASAVDSIL